MTGPKVKGGKIDWSWNGDLTDEQMKFHGVERYDPKTAGRKPRYVSDETRAEAVKVADEMGDAAAAALFKVHKCTVGKWRRKRDRGLGTARRVGGALRKYDDAVVRDAVRRILDGGERIRRVAIDIGVPRTTVGFWVEREARARGEASE